MGLKIKILTSILLMASILAAGIPNVALARWATYQDAEIVYEYERQQVYIYKDSRSTTLYEAQAKILKEDGKSTWAQYQHEYDSDMNIVQVLKATTTVNNKTYPVDSNQITDCPVTSEAQTFDSFNKMTIPYPNIDVNSTVYLKLKTNTKQNPIAPYYTNYFYFGYHCTKTSSIHIISEIPLYINTYDPEKNLTIQQKIIKEKNKIFYIIDIQQPQALYKQIIDENSMINPKHRPIVCVSSIKGRIPYANTLAVHYHQKKQEILPALYKEISERAKTKTTLAEKINTITSLLAEKITYLSSARTGCGGRTPQPLQQVTATRLGDCKDFATATSAILQSIGIPSKIACVYRGEAVLPPPDDLPNSPWHSNHVIVKVESPEGALWIDPTNFVSSTHLFPDISDRRAIVLEVNNSHYEMIPPIQAHNQQVIRTATWDIKEGSKAQIKGTLQFLGIAARQMGGMGKKHSEETIKNILVKILGNNQMPILNSQVSLPELNSRIINDLLFKYELTAQFSGLKTNAGQAMPLKFNFVKKLIAKPGTVSDLYLGTPQMIKDNLTLNNIQSVGQHPLNCRIQSPWANITRVVQYDKNKVSIYHELEIKKSWIPASEFKSEAYQKLQQELDQYFTKGSAIVIAS